MIIKIILPHTFKVDTTADYLIGVDYGAFQCAQNKIMMDVAIGDFDSVSADELEIIKMYSKEVIQLNVDKNETDSEAAIIHAKKFNPSEIMLIGDLGSRLDHLLTNIKLVSKYDVRYQSKDNLITSYNPGVYELKNEQSIISIITVSDAIISLSGTAYTLEQQAVSVSDNYLTSNKITEDVATLIVHQGKILLVSSSAE